MIAIACCTAILICVAVSGRILGARSADPAISPFQQRGYLGALGGLTLIYAFRLVQALSSNPAWYLPTYRMQTIIALGTLSSLGFALHNSAHTPGVRHWVAWWANEAKAPRLDLFTAVGFLGAASALLILSPAVMVNGQPPVLHPLSVQLGLCALVLPVIGWLLHLSVVIGQQVAITPPARMRMRFATYSIVAWLIARVVFDVILASSWTGWMDVGLVIDTALIAGVTFLIVATGQRRVVEAIDRFGAEYVMESMAEAMVAIDTDGVIRAVNHSAQQMIGRPKKDILGHTAQSVLDPKWWALAKSQTHTAQRQHEDMRTITTAAGDLRYVASRMVTLTDGTNAPVGHVEILHDVTEYREAQERLAEYSQMLEERIADRSRALAESEERYRGLVDHLADCLLIIKDETVRFANPAARALWETHAPTLAGVPVSDLWDTGIAAPWSELRTRLAEDPTLPWRGAMQWRAEDDIEREFLVTASTGRWEGEPAILLVGSDNTERAKLQASMDRVRRLQALGTLTGGIAHDFNNYLTSILGRLSMLEHAGLDGGPAHKNVKRALEAAEKARQLVSRLMRFTRPEQSGRTPTDLCALLRDTEPLLKSLVSEEVRLEWAIPPQPLWANVDTAAIQEILLNLAKNADDAMRENPGGLILSARAHETPDGMHVQLVVTDTGPGLNDDVKAHLFEPFFTTKPVGQGHGLGLALAHQIMQEHDGAIDAESEGGRGTTFTLTLPACAAPIAVEPTRPELDLALVEGAGELILVVDDDPDVLQTAGDMLARLGYQVLTASDGRMALQVVEQESTIAAIVLDIVMPEMNGVECAKELLARGTTAPIIFMTGYDPDPERIAELGVDIYTLSKPFRLRDIATVLSDHIAAARAAA